MPTILFAPAVPSSNHRMIRALTLVLCCMFAAGCHLGGRKRSVGVVGVRLDPGVEISALEVRNPVGRIQVRDCTETQAAGVEVEVLLVVVTHTGQQVPFPSIWYLASVHTPYEVIPYEVSYGVSHTGSLRVFTDLMRASKSSINLH